VEPRYKKSRLLRSSLCRYTNRVISGIFIARAWLKPLKKVSFPNFHIGRLSFSRAYLQSPQLLFQCFSSSRELFKVLNLASLMISQVHSFLIWHFHRIFFKIRSFSFNDNDFCTMIFVYFFSMISIPCNDKRSGRHANINWGWSWIHIDYWDGWFMLQLLPSQISEKMIHVIH